MYRIISPKFFTEIIIVICISDGPDNVINQLINYSTGSGG